MAKQTIHGATITIEVDDKGSLKNTEKKARKTGQGFNLLDKNVHSTDRAMKGLSQQSSNASKNFSKMSQGITGGLVPAYATLAAQLFAVDAVFRFLKDAADFRVLQEGQARFAAITGKAMRSLAKDLQAATDGQITFKEASQAGAIGLASGLSPSQLNELGEAARKVSIALGRDTTDSFNRLVRGVTKAEPELLDELGIVLRLEEATTRYAAALNLNKNELTTFQKSQAIANDVLLQADEKFGLIEGRVSALTQLGVQFDEVLNNIRNAIAPVAEFFGKTLADSIWAASAAIGVFVASIGKQLLPGIQTLATPELFKGMRTDVLSQVTGTGKAGKARLERLEQGVSTKKDLQDFQKSLDTRKKLIKNHHSWTLAQEKRLRMELKLLIKQREIDEATGFKKIRLRFKMHLTLMLAEYGKFIGSMKILQQALVGLMSFAGWLGIAVIAIQMVVQAWKFFNPDPENLVKFRKETDELSKSLNTLGEELKGVADSFEKGELKSKGLMMQIQQIGNAIVSADLGTNLRKYMDLQVDKVLDPEAFAEVQTGMLNVLESVRKFDVRAEELFTTIYQGNDITEEHIQLGMKLVDFYGDATAAVTDYNQSKKNELKITNDLIQTLPQLPYSKLITEIITQEKALERMIKVAKELGDELGVQELESEMVFARRMKDTWFIINEKQTEFKLGAMLLQMEAERTTLGLKAVREAKNRAKIGQQEFKLREMEVAFELQKLFVAEQMEDLDEKRRKELEYQLELSGLAIQAEREKLEMLEKQADMMNKAVTNIYNNLEKDLGQAIGGAIRNEEDAFAKIGTNITKAISDEMGRVVAGRLMEDLFGGWGDDKEKSPGEEIADAVEKSSLTVSDTLSTAFTSGADKIETAVVEGGKDAAAAISDAITGTNEAKEKLARDRAEIQLKKIKDLEKRREGQELYEGSQAFIGSTVAEQLFMETLSKHEMDQYRKGKAVDFQSDVYRDPKKLAALGFTGPNASEDFKNRPNQVSSMPSGLSFDEAFKIWKSEQGKMWTEANQWLEKYDQMLIKDKNAPGGQRYVDVPDGQEKYSADTTWEIGAFGWDYDSMVKSMRSQRNLYSWTQNDLSDIPTTVNGFNINAMTAPGYLQQGLQQWQGPNWQGDPNVTPGRITQADIAGEYDVLNQMGYQIGDDGKLQLLDGSIPVVIQQNNDKEEKDGEGTGENGEIVAGAGTTPKKSGAETFNEGVQGFADGITKMGGGIAMLATAAGNSDKAAKVMEIAAKVQMAAAIVEQTTAALKAATGDNPIFSFFKAFLGFGRYGGVFSPAGRSFSGGGVATGPESGYGAVLHGTEAVVPLGNDRSIPVKGNMAGNTNTTINVNMAEGSSDTTSDAESGKQLAIAINAAVQKEIEVQQRPGGLIPGGG